MTGRLSSIEINAALKDDPRAEEILKALRMHLSRGRSVTSAIGGIVEVVSHDGTNFSWDVLPFGAVDSTFCPKGAASCQLPYDGWLTEDIAQGHGLGL